MFLTEHHTAGVSLMCATGHDWSVRGAGAWCVSVSSLVRRVDCGAGSQEAARRRPRKDAALRGRDTTSDFETSYSCVLVASTPKELGSMAEVRIAKL